MSNDDYFFFYKKQILVKEKNELKSSPGHETRIIL